MIRPYMKSRDSVREDFGGLASLRNRRLVVVARSFSVESGESLKVHVSMVAPFWRRRGAGSARGDECKKCHRHPPIWYGGNLGVSSLVVLNWHRFDFGASGNL